MERIDGSAIQNLGIVCRLDRSETYRISACHRHFPHTASFLLTATDGNRLPDKLLYVVSTVPTKEPEKSMPHVVKGKLNPAILVGRL
jgi:hypothetical protein